VKGNMASTHSNSLSRRARSLMNVQRSLVLSQGPSPWAASAMFLHGTAAGTPASWCKGGDRGEGGRSRGLPEQGAEGGAASELPASDDREAAGGSPPSRLVTGDL